MHFVIYSMIYVFAGEVFSLSTAERYKHNKVGSIIMGWPIHLILMCKPRPRDTNLVDRDLAELRCLIFSPEELALRDYSPQGYDRDFPKTLHLANDGKCVICRRAKCDGKCAERLFSPKPQRKASCYYCNKKDDLVQVPPPHSLVCRTCYRSYETAIWHYCHSCGRRVTSSDGCYFPEKQYYLCNPCISKGQFSPAKTVTNKESELGFNCSRCSPNPLIANKHIVCIKCRKEEINESFMMLRAKSSS